MIYNTTLISGNGKSWRDDRGNILTPIGNQNLYVGKNVYTDGKVIYGYNVDSTMRKVHKSKIIRNECVLLGYTGFNGLIPADNGKVKGFVPKNYARTYASRPFNGVFEANGNVVCANRPIIAGNTLYNLYEHHSNNQGLYVLQKNGGGECSLGRVDNQSQGSNAYYCFDAGRNGGFAMCIQRDNGFDVRFIPPEFDKYYYLTSENLQTWVASYFQNTPSIDNLRCLNVDDNGEMSFAFRGWDAWTQTERYFSMFFSRSDGGRITGYNPVCGDGTGSFSTTTGRGTITYEIDNGDGTTSTYSINAGYQEKLTITKKYVFLHAFNGMGTYYQQTPDGTGYVKQYDLTGNLLREYATSSVYANPQIQYSDLNVNDCFYVSPISNTRLDFVDFYKWLKKYNYK